MRLDPNKEYYEQEFGWVAHPEGTGSYYGRSDLDNIEKEVVARRYELDIIGGISDNDASYSYDDWALAKLDGKYYLFSTSGCSCPSPTETWRIEIGPATLAQVRKHVLDGDYDGYTMPKKQMEDFVALLDKAEKDDRK
jgi:hypothetical protein